MTAAGRLVGGMLGAVLAAISLATMATDDLPEANLCTTVVAPETLPATFAATENEFDRRLHSDPAYALQLACHATRIAAKPRARLRARVLLGSALLKTARTEDGVRVLQTLLAELSPATAAERVDLAEVHYWLGTAAVERLDHGGARQHFTTARELLEAASSTRTRLYAAVLNGQAAAFTNARDFPEAEAALEKAQALLKQLDLGVSRDAADVLNTRTVLAFQRQDLEGAARYAQAEVDMTIGLSGRSSPELLDPYASLGAIYSMLGRFGEAEHALTEGMRIGDAAPDVEVSARLGNMRNLAVLFMDRGQYDLALPIAEKALVLAEQHFPGGGPQVFRQVTVVASVYRELGRYVDAQRMYARAQALDDAAKPGSIDILRRLNFFLARTQLDFFLGDMEAAREHLQRAEQAMGSDDKLGYYRGWAARMACAIATRAADWRTADARCADAVEHNSKALGKDNRLVFAAITARCQAETNGGLAGDACDDTARRLESPAPMHPLVRYNAYAALANRAAVSGNAEEALRLRKQALAVAQAIGAADPLWSAQDELARTLRQRDQRTLAIFIGKQAIASIEGMREQFVADAARLENAFLADKVGVYRRVADWLMEEGRFDEALEVIRLLKREEYFDFIQRAAGAAPAGEPVPWDAMEQELAADYAQVRDPALRLGADYERLARLQDANRITAEERQRLGELAVRRDVLERELGQRIDAFLAEHTRMARSLRSATSGVARKLDARRVPRDAALGVYLFGENRVRLLISTRLGRVMRDIPVPPAELSLRIGRFLAAMEAREDVTSQAEALYQLVGRPLDDVARQVGARQLVLWLDGPLRYLPFAALHDGRSWLIERYALQLHAGAVGDEPPRPATAATGVRAFAVANAVGDLPALPAMADEICAVVRGPVLGSNVPAAPCLINGSARGALTGEGYLDGEFNETRLRHVLEGNHQFSYLHLATHFSLRPGNVSRSYLMLGDGTRLTLEQLRALSFGGLDLVTLSACETAIGGAGDGREVEGLGGVIQRGGARQVLASLWRVEDSSTSLLMQRLYQALAAHAPPAQALRQAQLAVRAHAATGGKRYLHPYYWAGFVLSSAEP